MKEEYENGLKLIKRLERNEWIQLERKVVLILNEFVKTWKKFDILLMKEDENMIHEFVGEIKFIVSKYSFELLFIERTIDFYSSFKNNSVKIFFDRPVRPVLIKSLIVFVYKIELWNELVPCFE